MSKESQVLHHQAAVYISSLLWLSPPNFTHHILTVLRGPQIRGPLTPLNLLSLCKELFLGPECTSSLGALSVCRIPLYFSRLSLQPPVRSPLGALHFHSTQELPLLDFGVCNDLFSMSTYEKVGKAGYILLVSLYFHKKIPQTCLARQAFLIILASKAQVQGRHVRGSVYDLQKLSIHCSSTYSEHVPVEDRG